MLSPVVRAGIVKAYERVGRPDDRANIAAFVAITEGAGQRKIIFARWATMFFANDMIDLAAKIRIVFVDQAILADVFSPRHDEPP